MNKATTSIIVDIDTSCLELANARLTQVAPIVLSITRKETIDKFLI